MHTVRLTIDVGHHWIKGLVMNIDEGQQTIIAKEKEKTQGYRKGKILDLAMLTQSLHNLVSTFQTKLGGEYIDEVVVGISHPDLMIERISEHKRIIGTDVIMSQDIHHLSRLIADMSIKPNHEILKIIPVYRLLDDTTIEKNPEGLQAKKLSLTADIFCLPKPFYQAIVEVFQKLSLNVIDIVPNILALGENVIDVDHRDLGTVLIDMGANHTTYVVYEEGYPLVYGCIPVGGEDVSKDISIGLQIDIKHAEKSKVSMNDQSAEGEDQELDNKFLQEIIAARYEQVYEKIQKQLERLGRDGKLAGGVYLSGMAAEWYGSIQLAKHIFRLAVFDAHDMSGHHGDLATNKHYLACLGLHLRTNKYHQQQSSFSFGSVQRAGKGVMDGIMTTLKKWF